MWKVVSSLLLRPASSVKLKPAPGDSSPVCTYLTRELDKSSLVKLSTSRLSSSIRPFSTLTTETMKLRLSKYGCKICILSRGMVAIPPSITLMGVISK